MSKKYLLAIDAGTGSGRAVIFDELGNQISMSQVEWTHANEVGVEGSMNFDCETNWKLLCGCIKGAISKAYINSNDILALSSSSMREGIVLYDTGGREIWAVANVDSRAGAEVVWLKQNYPNLEAEVYAKSGQTFALSALPRLLWVKNNRPKIYEKISKISMISDWILYKLCGELVSEPSNAGTAGIFNLKSRAWDGDIASRVGLKNDIFPPCKESGEIIGEVGIAAAEQTGLSIGTKVVLGGGDVQIGCAGLGLIKEGDSAVLGGSFWQQIVNVKSSLPPSDMSIRLNPHTANGLYQAEAISFFTGLVMRWFRDAFCDSEKIAAKARNIDTYSLLEEMAQSVPVGSYGVVPIFSDTMKYGKWYHAAPSFINLSIDATKCNKAVLFRALEENAAIVSAINLDNIERFSGVKANSIIFAAGASKGFLWPEILASATKKEVKIPIVKEATSLGCAIYAGVAVGLYSDIDEACKSVVRMERVVEPNIPNSTIYDEMKNKWSEIYKRELSLVDDGLTTSMWKAPGI